MLVKKGASQYKLGVPKVSRGKLVLYIAVSLLCMLAVYSFFYVLREGLMSISFNFNAPPIVLSPKERWVSNILFAGIGVSLGNSVFILLLFNGRRALFKAPKTQLKRIQNQQVFLQANFMYWFGKVSVLIGFAAMVSSSFGIVFSLVLPGILLFIVLFLESWKSLFLGFGLRRFLYMGIHLVISCGLIFSMALIHVTDYGKLEKLRITINPEVDLPTTSFYDQHSGFHRYNYQNLKIEWDGAEEFHFVDGYGAQFELAELPAKIQEYHSQTREELVPFFAIRLWVPQEFPYYLINNIRKHAALVNVSKMDYAVNTNATKISFLNVRYISSVIWHCEYALLDELKSNLSREIDVNALPYPAPCDPEELEYLAANAIRVFVGKTNYGVQGIQTTLDELEPLFKEAARSNRTVLFEFDQTTTFNTYIQALGVYKNVIWELRNSELPFYNYPDNVPYSLTADQEDQLIQAKLTYILRYLDAQVTR